MRLSKIVSAFTLALVLAMPLRVAAQEQTAPAGSDSLLVAAAEAGAAVARRDAAPALTYRGHTQQPTESERRAGLYKIIGGVGIASAGVLLAATSGESVTVTSDGPFGGTITASSRSTGKLVAGLAMIGGGSLLAILGFKDRNP